MIRFSKIVLLICLGGRWSFSVKFDFDTSGSKKIIAGPYWRLVAIFLQPLVWVSLQKFAEINNSRLLALRPLPLSSNMDFVSLKIKLNPETVPLTETFRSHLRLSFHSCLTDWIWWFLDFAAPTVEYLQKDFESAEGFFCGNRDTYLLHANDDNRYAFTFMIIENSCCNGEEQENICSTPAFWAFHVHRNIMKSDEIKHAMALVHTMRPSRKVLLQTHLFVTI